jgi:hypothetical protein
LFSLPWFKWALAAVTRVGPLYLPPVADPLFDLV